MRIKMAIEHAQNDAAYSYCSLRDLLELDEPVATRTPKNKLVARLAKAYHRPVPPKKKKNGLCRKIRKLMRRVWVFLNGFV